MRRSARYEAYVRDLSSFLDAYTTLVAAVRQATDGSYMLGVDSSLDFLRPEDNYLLDQTAEAAGRAHAAVTASGYHMQQFGQVFNPIVDWQRSFLGAGVSPDTVASYTRQLMGMYERRAADARDKEKGLVGLLATFVRFPTDVREAAGLSSKAGQASAFLVGVAAQVLAALIVTGVLATIGYGLSRLVN